MKLPSFSRSCLAFTRLFSLALAGCSGVALLTPAQAAASQPPNLLIIYADDLGWGELGCQGSKDIPTPHIDSIARNGIRFTQGYVAATYCSPSRAGLMTGRYPTRFGHEFNSVANQTGLRLDQRTIADRLKPLGYATACVGKWHLGAGPDYRPTKRGFDEFYGTLNNTPFYHPTNFVDSRVSEAVRAVPDPDFYTTDAYTERSLDWLERNQSRPWFLYLPYNAQHAPLQAPRKYLDRFSSMADERRRTFAAMMAAMDDGVGRILAKIRALGQEERTIVFFIGDNGGPTQSTTSSNGPLRGYKMTTYEGGPRVPFLAQWKGTWPGGRTYDLPVMNLDVLPTIVAAAGGKVAPEWQLDGVDLTPFVTGKVSSRPHETLYWRYGPQWAIRDGDYKLVVSRGGGGPEPELYDLAVDLRESNNLAGRMPAKVKELKAKWDKWSAEQAEPSAPDSPAKAKKAAKQNKKKTAAK
ncbi:MAG: sulfatase [Verrucomicrobia bacterium]|nr:sulfatase [Verrucomicrobiota bacterium]